METFWFIAVAAMLGAYIVLDGFVFGVGIIYPFVARTEEERQAALASIGPVWMGNEVWLIAGGGVLFFAFPRAFASSFSGFYLALIIVLWLLILRGLALELRSYLDHPVWKPFWDLAFSGSSLLLAVVFGAALGNLIRGIPLSTEGFFFVPLWTDLLPGPQPGILDWFTVLLGLEGAAVLALHGATYLVLKTEGPLQERAETLARRAGTAVLVLTVLVLAAVHFVQPELRHNYDDHPMGYLLPFAAAVALAGTLVLGRWHSEGGAFVCSSAFITGMLASAAWEVYPNILIATSDPARSLTIANSASGSYGLQMGVGWFLIGMALVVTYQVYVYRSFRGKVRPSRDGH